MQPVQASFELWQVAQACAAGCCEGHSPPLRLDLTRQPMQLQCALQGHPASAPLLEALWDPSPAERKQRCQSHVRGRMVLLLSDLYDAGL